MSTPQSPQAAGTSVQPSASRFVSLRTKFVAFFSLILIVACSTLTWYFIETRRAAMIQDLQQLGTILLTSVVNNGQFRYGGLIAEDRATLRQFTESLMAVEDVVYVVIRGADHMILAQQNKLVKESSGSLTFSQERRLYPDEQLALEVAQTPITVPRMTPVSLSKEHMTLLPSSAEEERSWLLSPSSSISTTSPCRCSAGRSPIRPCRLCRTNSRRLSPAAKTGPNPPISAWCRSA